MWQRNGGRWWLQKSWLGSGDIWLRLYRISQWLGKRHSSTSGCDSLECAGICYTQRNCGQSTRCHLPGSLSGVDEDCALSGGQLRAFLCGFLCQTFRKKKNIFLISNFRLVLNVVCFLLGNFLTSEFYIPTFRYLKFYTYLHMKMEQSVPKRRHIKFRRRGITQKKAHRNIVVTKFRCTNCTMTPNNISEEGKPRAHVAINRPAFVFCFREIPCSI